MFLPESKGFVLCTAGIFGHLSLSLSALHCQGVFRLKVWQILVEARLHINPSAVKNSHLSQ